MSSSTAEQPTGNPPGPRTHPVLGFVRALDGALDRVHAVDPVFMTPADKRAALVELTREQHRIEALKLKLLAAADLDEVGAVNGSASTGAWLSHATHCDVTEARGQVRLATRLEREHAGPAGELAAGGFSAEHARIILWALERLPDDLDVALLDQAEKVMVTEARNLTPSQLRIAGRHLLEVVAPDLADEMLRRQLERDEHQAYARARLTTRSNGDGTTQGWFRIPDLQAKMLAAALDAITAPRKRGQDKLDLRDPDTGQRLDHPTLAGQAFCEVLEHLPVDKLGDHGRNTATVVVTLSHETLVDALGAAGFATTSDGETISAAQARRLACNAGLIPAVLGRASVSLDLGRGSRYFTHAQRVLLELRDHGCRAETCDRPAAWTEAHHLTGWSDGGRTDLANGVLLCGHHHRLAHHGNYDHRRLPNGDIRFNRRT